MAPAYASSTRSASVTPQGHVVGNPRTPSSASKHRQVSLINRLNNTLTPTPGIPQPSSQIIPSSSPALEQHPVEVIGRIREHPEGSGKPSALQVLQNGQTVRLRTEQGYRDFSLDGVSLAEEEDLESFYKKYVESRIESVKLGGRCTVMMYGPTGAGKSHTMFGSPKEPGIAYRALQNILSKRNDTHGGSDGLTPDPSGRKFMVSVRILEIYNEDIFDLLASCPNTPNSWMKPRCRLEIMGKKAKNAISISGSDADQISKEIAKVEKRRIVKSTSCNERSSRSHCLVMLDVPAIGGRLVLVDMAGSENLEQAGVGVDLKMQTGKINQGNIALKRVVEAIANGDSYIPFRDSKLTMLLQDSFEDDEAKILMILCASPDIRDMYKTIGTLEYGCKAKCIVRLPVSPPKEKPSSTDKLDASVLEARIQKMDRYISKLEIQYQNKEKEKDETLKELIALREVLAKREEDAKLQRSKCCNNDLIIELENKIKECQRVAEEFVESEKKKIDEKEKKLDMIQVKMETRMKDFEREVDLLLKTIATSQEVVHGAKSTDYNVIGKRDEALENFRVAVEVNESKKGNSDEFISTTFINMPSKSDSPDSGSRNIFINIVDNTYHGTVSQSGNIDNANSQPPFTTARLEREVYEPDGWMPAIPEESEDEARDETSSSPALQQLPCLPIIAKEASAIDSTPTLLKKDTLSSGGISSLSNKKPFEENMNLSCANTPLNPADQQPTSASAASRRSRIENIFLLCGNRRELAAQKQHNVPTPVTRNNTISEQNCQSDVDRVPSDYTSAQAKVVDGSSLPSQNDSIMSVEISKGTKVVADRSPAHGLLSKSRHLQSENTPPQALVHGYQSPLHNIQNLISPPVLHDHVNPSILAHESAMKSDADKCEIYVKWETSKESSGKLINTIQMKQNATLAELRRQVEQQLSEEVKHPFVFLMLGDPSGSPIEREDEKQILVRSLPDCHRQRGSKLACLRPQLKQNTPAVFVSPLRSLENQITWNNTPTSKQPFQLTSPNPNNQLHKPNDRALDVSRSPATIRSFH